ncbi:MAG: GHMP kinase [Chloroflexi bacterium]|nr:GHMP kinase [Chloroflexota bacterium]
MIYRSKAPVRLDLAGGWSDVPPFSSKEGGAVVNVAIARYTNAFLVPRKDDAVSITSADFGMTVRANSLRELHYDGNLDLIKAALRRFPVATGIDLRVSSEMPPGSGTGTSASLGVALVGLLSWVGGRGFSPQEVAEEAHLLEVEEIHVPGGKQDQYASALGGFNYLEFQDPQVRVQALRLDAGFVEALQRDLVLCYTGRSRVSGDIIQAVIDSFQRGEPATVVALHNIKAVAERMRRALLSSDYQALAHLLSENWAEQMKLHASVTSPEIDALFARATRHGALGGKALGAGGGGCLLFLCQPGKAGVVRAELASAGAQVLDFDFDTRGLQVWSEPWSQPGRDT